MIKMKYYLRYILTVMSILLLLSIPFWVIESKLDIKFTRWEMSALTFPFLLVMYIVKNSKILEEDEVEVENEKKETKND